MSWGKNTALNDADLPPELVTQPEGVVGCNQVEEGGDDSDDGVENDDNDDTRARFWERSWDRRSEEEGHRRDWYPNTSTNLIYFNFGDAAMRKIAMDVNEDRHVTGDDVQELVLNGCSKVILEVVQKKIDMLSFLSRPQLLPLSFALKGVSNFVEKIVNQYLTTQEAINPLLERIILKDW